MSGLALLTDLYQLTMAAGYLAQGRREDEAVFHLFYRTNPFGGGYAVMAGVDTALDYLEGLRFSPEDCAYLGGLCGNDGQPLFRDDFLTALREFRFTCDVDAVPEGTVVFPHEPLVRVSGPLWQAQLVETALLNIINFQTLIATKASRLVRAAKGEPVIEFGLRRAQGIDGALAASRAAWLGGVDATSNVLAGRRYGIPVKGTHAHSWVMVHDDELAAFSEYAAAMPNNCIFLVDTYDTLAGVRNAVRVGRQLRERGHELVGIRLDSGDLAWLSIEARKILDAAGFPDVRIVASNDLDEHLIRSLKEQGAAIDIWGIGTKLATAYDQPALGGVYKLAAIRQGGEPWQHRIKLSEQAVKVSTPGKLNTWRYQQDGRYCCDILVDELAPPAEGMVLVDPADPTRRRPAPAGASHEELLQPLLRGGVSCDGARVPLEAARQRCQRQLAGFYDGILRFDHPHEYPVGLEQGLNETKTRLIMEARARGAAS
jgi:nicotinate phosphoribosyltransferase